MTAVRKRLNEKEPTTTPINNYFTTRKDDLQFVSSGCEILDNVLGGGYVLGRMTNIIGDKSTAKTALATEAVNNFLIHYPDGKAYYRESEAAFDKKYAAAMGMHVDNVDFGEDNPVFTIEDFYTDLNLCLDECIQNDRPSIYVLDSLDALSDEEELKRDIDKGSYGMAKQKKLGEMFRKCVKKIEKAKMLLIIISQVRDNIGVTFGEKHRRSGGKALDFYASQFLWLAHMGQIKKTVKGIERVVGIKIKANCKKNKIGFPFRTCEFDFMFGYGVDDVSANINWLKEVKRLDVLNLSEKDVKNYIKETNIMDAKEFEITRSEIAKKVREVWSEVETTFLPSRKKYV